MGIEEPTFCFIRKRTCCGVSIAISTVMLIGGILCLALVPWIIHETITEQLSLNGPRSKLMPTFFNSTGQGVETRDIYHFFHVTNYWDVTHNGAEPILELKGPYVYEHIKWRPEEEIHWFANGTMQYKSLVVNKFVPEESVVDNENETVCTPRAGILIALQNGAHMGIQDLVIKAIQETPNVNSLLQNRTIHELIHGYHEPVLENIIFKLAGQSSIVAFDPDTTDVSKVAPTEIRAGFTRAKGEPEPPKYSFGDYTMYAGMRTLPFWGSEEANTIKGTGATMYAPLMMLDGRNLNAYVSDIQRSITLVNTGKFTDNSIPVHRYRLDDRLFHNETVYPPNKAFFISHTGLQPTAPANNKTTGQSLDKEWIFAALSKCMLLDADMNGINVKLPRKPNRATDDIFLDYEPITSTLLEGHKRLQLNLNFRPIPGVNASKNLNKAGAWLPVFMTDECATLPKKDRDTLKDDVLTPLLLVLVLGILLVIFGFFGILISTFCLCRTPTLEELQDDALNNGGRKNSGLSQTDETGALLNSDRNIEHRQDSFSPQGREFQAKGV